MQMPHVSAPTQSSLVADAPHRRLQRNCHRKRPRIFLVSVTSIAFRSQTSRSWYLRAVAATPHASSAPASHQHRRRCRPHRRQRAINRKRPERLGFRRNRIFRDVGTPALVDVPCAVTRRASAAPRNRPRRHRCIRIVVSRSRRRKRRGRRAGCHRSRNCFGDVHTPALVDVLAIARRTRRPRR